MAHSAGAAIIARIAWEHPEISQLLLVNPAAKLGIEKMQRGLSEFNGDKLAVLFGSKDPSVQYADELSNSESSPLVHIVILDGVDHNFSKASSGDFIEASDKYIFSQEGCTILPVLIPLTPASSNLNII